MIIVCFFFFKQKTEYEMRISDWSSDVCSSDLGGDNTGNDQMNRVEIVDIFGIALALAHPEKTPRYCLERLEEVQFAPGKFFDVISHVVSRPRTRQDRKSVGEGKSVSVRVDLGGRRIIKKKKKKKHEQKQ